MLAVLYHIKRRYHVSTYMEIVSMLIQSTVILGLICAFQGLGFFYIATVVPMYAAFFTCISNKDVSTVIIDTLQVLATTIQTLAGVPQIWLTYKTKHASWSATSAFLSIMGCIVRIITTLRLTKDKISLIGYSCGLVVNSLLLAQILYYNHFLSPA
jgi:mannose-P-dolichol utilization defect 1